MTPLTYAASIFTAAAWLSVSSIGSIGMAVSGTFGLPHAKNSPENPHDDLKSTLLMDDFTGPAETPSQETETGDTGEAAEADVPLAPAETLPEPPEIPETEDTAPLPEIPEFAKPVEKPAPEKLKPAAPKVKPAPKPRPQPRPKSAKPTTPTSKIGGSPQGREGARGTQGNGGRNGGSGMSDARRIAGGRMPAPSYPAAARRGNQTGTVVVEFVVGETGSVISAYAKRPCPWPLLNDAAVKAVRRWKFPPGRVSKHYRPITFRLK